MEFNTLTTTLTTFVTAYSAAYARVQPIAHKVLGSLALIEIALAGMYLALDGGHQVSALFGKFLKIAVWTYITTNFHQLVQAFSQSLIGAGLIAAGQPGNFQILLDPSKVAAMGTTATDGLVHALSNIGTFDFFDAVVFGLMYMAIMLTFLLMAVQMFLAVAEFYLISALAGVLIGFGVSPHFRFLSEKAIGAVVACSIKLMVLAFIMAMVQPTLASVRFVGPDIKFNELWALLLTSGTIMLFSWTAPSLAASLLAGSPSLGAGGVAQNVMSGRDDGQRSGWVGDDRRARRRGAARRWRARRGRRGGRRDRRDRRIRRHGLRCERARRGRRRRSRGRGGRRRAREGAVRRPPRSVRPGLRQGCARGCTQVVRRVHACGGCRPGSRVWRIRGSAGHSGSTRARPAAWAEHARRSLLVDQNPSARPIDSSAREDGT